jgi:sugar transferase (PEP-CTERM/EpsH1 system associated)
LLQASPKTSLEASPTASAAPARARRLLASADNHAGVRPIRVMHVVGSLALAGMEYGVIKVVNRLPERIQPSICCLRHQEEATRAVLDPRVPVVELRRSTHRNYALVGVLAALFRRERIDVVHSHNWLTYLYTVLGARLAGVPVVIHGEHGHDEAAAPARRLWGKRALKPWVTRFVAVSANIARELEVEWGIPSQRIACIPNGVDLQSFGGHLDGARVRRELGLGPGDEVVLNVGGIRPVKDHPTLIRAFAHARASRPSARLVLVGTDYDRGLLSGLESLASELGVRGDVRFTGVRRDIPDLLAASDLYVNSSLYEGMSNTILEAMATRKPVVATAVGGNVDLVREGVTGRLVPASNWKRMGDRIAELLADRERRTAMGAAARLHVEMRHGMASMVDAYASLYSDCFERSRAGRKRAWPSSRVGV